MDKTSPKIWLPDHEAEISAWVSDEGKVTVNAQTVAMKLQPLVRQTGFKEEANG